MTNPVISKCPSHPVTIHIAGDYHAARGICRKFCDDVGLCVTVTPTVYIYTGGQEEGIRVGLINYPRFPKMPTAIEAYALELAYRLRDGLHQESFSIEAPDHTTWYSWREGDLQESTQKLDVDQFGT
ncbi:hypothetical protein IB276_22560 [Ensifer sp. ENS04]|uniref:hypothetical protein n=1 Tax=Ensifer sp. ENS04 TaxID=2769281 RepID=UPI00177C28DB|nr:hypothetical protein [Ensifer sp. ENS04]MBD9542231.1 hypothetical protein [Ensifer sp. ENS04]